LKYNAAAWYISIGNDPAAINVPQMGVRTLNRDIRVPAIHSRGWVMHKKCVRRILVAMATLAGVALLPIMECAYAIEGHEALRASAGSGDLATVKRLLAEGYNVNATGKGDVTPLMCAVWESRVEVVKVLIESGADTNARVREGTRLRYIPHLSRQPPCKDIGGMTAMDVAKCNGSWEVLRVLSAHRALFDACNKGNAETVKDLLNAGASTHGRDPEYLASPLHWASYRGHKAVVAVLLEKGAPIDALNKEGRTPLMMASGSDRDEVVKLLIEMGADTGVKDKSGRTALDYASGNGHKEVAKLLQGGKTR
jgi:uncharacterized protein